MLKRWLETSRCHRLILTSSADTNVSPSLYINKHLVIAFVKNRESVELRSRMNQ
jgi:hypothetical protein